MRTATNSRSYALAAGLLAGLPLAADTCNEPCEPIVTDLTVEGADVGDFTVWSDGTSLNVTYEVTDPGWDLEATHLYVSREQPGHSAGAGQLPYAHYNFFGDTDSYRFRFSDLGASPKARLYIAGLADLEGLEFNPETSLAGLMQALPEDTVMGSVAPSEGILSPLNLTFGENSTLTGSWHAWSGDADPPALTPWPVQMHLFSSYDPDLASLNLFAYPEHMDKVNWVLNHYNIGQMANDGQVFSAGDLQVAYWMLLDGEPGGMSSNRWSWDHVDEIVQAATFEGGGFMPGCFEKVAVVAAPIGSRGVVAFFGVEYTDLSVFCGPEWVRAPAWADGTHPMGFGEGSYMDWSCR